MIKTLKIDLDSLYEQGYFYTKFDIGNEGHSITIRESNKEKFLDAFAKEWRKRADESLEEVDENDEDN